MDSLLPQSHQLSHHPHMRHTVDQFAYVQGQITALSSQIDDLSVDHGLDSESDQFQPFGHSGKKGGENFEGELAQCQEEHRFRLKNIGFIGYQFIWVYVFCFYNH